MAEDAGLLYGYREYHVLRRLAWTSAFAFPSGLVLISALDSSTGLMEGKSRHCGPRPDRFVTMVFMGLVWSPYVVSRCARVRLLPGREA